MLNALRACYFFTMLYPFGEYYLCCFSTTLSPEGGKCLYYSSTIPYLIFGESCLCHYSAMLYSLGDITCVILLSCLTPSGNTIYIIFLQCLIPGTNPATANFRFHWSTFISALVPLPRELSMTKTPSTDLTRVSMFGIPIPTASSDDSFSMSNPRPLSRYCKVIIFLWR